jgi:hypothetical protein
MRRTLVWDVLFDANGRMVDLPSSSSDENGSSLAVLKDSVLDSVGVPLTAASSLGNVWEE